MAPQLQQFPMKNMRVLQLQEPDRDRQSPSSGQEFPDGRCPHGAAPSAKEVKKMYIYLRADTLVNIKQICDEKTEGRRGGGGGGGGRKAA